MNTNLLLTYKDYQDGTDPFTMDELIGIHDDLVKSMLEKTDDDEFAEELFQDVLKKAKHYVVDFRYPWFTEYSQNDRNGQDEVRTAAHNQFIRSLDFLARFQEQNGIDTSWRERLGEAVSHRKRIGDFACYLVFIAAVNGR